VPVSRRVRGLLGLGEPALRRPRVQRPDPVRRSFVGAFWAARVSVRAGILLDDFLRSRLARYLAALAVPRARLPLAIEVDDGQITVRPLEPERVEPHGDGDPEPWLAALVAAEGPAVRSELAELEVRCAVLDGEVEAARKHADDVSRRLASDASAGLVLPPPALEATAEQLGRPPVRSAAAQNAALAFAVGAAAAETWQVALPLLRRSGIDADAIRAELSRAPAEVVFVSLFALGASAALFALAQVGFAAVTALFHGEPDPSRRPWLRAAAAGAAAFACLLAVAVGSLGREPAAPPRWASVVLLLAVPLATALVLRAGRREAAERAKEIAASLAWDRDRSAALADRARRLEELDWAEEQETRLEAQREAARRRLRELSARAVEAGRLSAEAQVAERAALARVAQSLVGALDLDRYEFIRQASAHGAVELIAPRRRKPAEARPFYEGPTSAAPAQEAQSGRMAS
jgi:hypothetical protein